MTDPARLAELVKARAEEEGFDRVGIARSAHLDRDAASLAAWLANDRNASMTWMARDPSMRSDPRRLLPDCRSVIALAMNYWPGEEAARTEQGKARVALYARGRDYHRVLGHKLKTLAAWLAELSGKPARSFVDTGPVLERAWAERAGIGWIGKNANLLTRELGSWLLLGEVLSCAEIVPDPGPPKEHCGSCTACIDACPTGAIVQDGVVDSNRCISYWTIEHRGPIPEERRGEPADWIFGCDVCQEVCPWNVSSARPVEGDPFRRREELSGLDPEKILGLDEATFRARYSGTALMRAKWEGMRRNACVLLGRRRRPESLPALARALTDRDEVIRGHAAWAIGLIGDDGARRLLERAAKGETSPEVRVEIRRALDAS
jgi:epoxyqueuosine reductase